MIGTENLANLTDEEYYALIGIIVGYKLGCERKSEKFDGSANDLGKLLHEQNLANVDQADRLLNRIRNLYSGKE